MEIKIVDNKVICEFFSDTKHTVQEEMQIMQAMKDIMLSISNKNKEEIVTSSKPNSVANPTSKEDRNIIRKRIPNNIVDLNEIEIQKAKEVKSLIRCPKCGQGHCVLIEDKDKTIYMLEKDMNANDFKIILSIRKEDIDNFRNSEYLYVNTGEETRLEYYNKLQKILASNPKEINNDFIVDKDTVLECPVCGYTDSFKEWNNAYKDPIAYISYDKVCDVCGGAIIKSFIKNKDGMTEQLSCDTCGKDYKL